MIKIYKDKDIKVVTKGAYRAFYEHLGYEVMSDKSNEMASKKEEVKVVEHDKVEPIRKDKVENIEEDNIEKKNYKRK